MLAVFRKIAVNKNFLKNFDQGLLAPILIPNSIAAEKKNFDLMFDEICHLLNDYNNQLRLEKHA